MARSRGAVVTAAFLVKGTGIHCNLGPVIIHTVELNGRIIVDMISVVLVGWIIPVAPTWSIGHP
jgi:hypothetical protein